MREAAFLGVTLHRAEVCAFGLSCWAHWQVAVRRWNCKRELRAGTERGVGYLIGVPVDADSTDILVFEADRSEVPDGLVLASNEPGRIADRARVPLEEALVKLRPSLHKIVHLLRELSPSDTEVTFGLKVGGETGMIIAKGTAEVNFTVRMSWSGE